MSENTTVDTTVESVPTKENKIKDFYQKHKKKIFIGGAAVISIAGLALLAKNSEDDSEEILALESNEAEQLAIETPADYNPTITVTEV